jgi:hypothetical protein
VADSHSVVWCEYSHYPESIEGDGMKYRLKLFHLLMGAGGLLLTLAPLCGSVTTARADGTRTPIEGGDAPPSVKPGEEPTSFPQGPLFPYSLLDEALAGNVEADGNVRYSDLKDNPKLRWFLKAVATADLNQFPVFEFTENDPETGRPTIKRKDHTMELIFWINAYNALRLSAIAEAYPLKSIDDIKDFDTAKTHVVAGKKYSFKELREKVLSFGDPRALFALTTGTTGGFLPSPAAVRYVEYDDRMNAAVSVFINDPRNVTIDRLQNVVKVNSTLKDVSDLFKTGRRQKYEGIRYVLAGYTEGNAKGYLGSGEYRIEFKEADRTLNDKSMRGLNS